MFSSGIVRVSERVCSKFSKGMQLKLREIAVKCVEIEQMVNAICALLSYGCSWEISKHSRIVHP